MTYQIRWEPIIDGYICWYGIYKIAVLSTSHHQGLVRNGQLLYEAQPREDWGLHFTTPALRVELIEAILKSIPKEAVVTKAK